MTHGEVEVMIQRASLSRSQNLSMWLAYSSTADKTRLLQKALDGSQRQIVERVDEYTTTFRTALPVTAMNIDRYVIDQARCELPVTIIDWDAIEVESEHKSIFTTWKIKWIGVTLLREGRGLYRGSVWMM